MHRRSICFSVCCAVCDYYVHAECQEFALNNCKSSATYRPRQIVRDTIIPLFPAEI